eukprot:Skav229384  [mRNA]  locus=scaffold4358:38946:39296:- [translate_table: standard]
MDAVLCQECGEWTSIEDDALECEDCQDIWCDHCAHRGPCKIFVPCRECPDFSKTHCWECFAAGKIQSCECRGTDTWHSCCGRHTFHCEKCDASLCDTCVQIHHYDCPDSEDEGDTK